MRVVVVGCGRVGGLLASTLSEEGHDVVVVDRSKAAFASLGSEFNGETVTGTGIDEDVLRRAGIEQAEACAAVTNDDNTNIMAAQVAKHVFQVPKVVARIYDPDRERTYHQLGLETVSTTKIGVAVIRNLLATNGLRRRGTLGAGESELVEAVVREGMAGKTVAELEMAGVFRVAAVVRDGQAAVAEPGLVLQEGDVLVAAVCTRALKQIKAKLGV
ncbi:MAG TPA: TrkA family potassium uptake protein [Firmicutes bacterium]|nr:TrkA family potassium uptake protein [Bacillota bacterium]